MEPSLERHLRDLEERLLGPQTRGDACEVAALLDEGFVEFGTSGRVYDRATVATALERQSQEPVPRTFESITDFGARLLASGVVLVTYRVHERAGAGELPGASLASLRSSIWRLGDGGGWRMVFHQGTRCAT
jgi:hypothetical protein